MIPQNREIHEAGASMKQIINTSTTNLYGIGTNGYEWSLVETHVAAGWCPGTQIGEEIWAGLLKPSACFIAPLALLLVDWDCLIFWRFDTDGPALPLHISRNLPCNRENWWDMEMPRTCRKMLDQHLWLAERSKALNLIHWQNLPYCWKLAVKLKVEGVTGWSPNKAWKCELCHASGWLRCLRRNVRTSFTQRLPYVAMLVNDSLMPPRVDANIFKATSTMANNGKSGRQIPTVHIHKHDAWLDPLPQRNSQSFVDLASCRHKPCFTALVWLRWLLITG